MISLGFELPQGARRGPFVVIIILEKENLDSLRNADPFDMLFSQYAALWPIHRPIKDLDLVIAYEEDQTKLLEFRDKQDLKGLLNWLQRNREIKKADLQPPQNLGKI